MNIGLIDADLLGQPNHRFPNLALMKISGYHKKLGHKSKLIIFDDIDPNKLLHQKFDWIYVSKVFTSSHIPEFIKSITNLMYGGTGFYYDKAPKLPIEIEHAFPDYHLYDDWIRNEMRFHGRKRDYFKYYTDFSIGFTTRGCFRQCQFCINRNEKIVYPHSPLMEFVDKDRKKICLLDDNILGCGSHWERIIKELQATGKSFQFKQGMDIRLLSNKKAELLSNCKYEGDYIFAFDNIADREVIEVKLKTFKQYMPDVVPKLYVFCAFDREGKYDEAFWEKDFTDLFERLCILMKYKAIPYIMKFEEFRTSKYRQFYGLLSRWGMPKIFKKQSFREYHAGNKYFFAFEKRFPHIAKKYFDMKFDNETKTPPKRGNKQVQLFNFKNGNN